MRTVTAIVSAYYAQQFILDRLYNLQEQDPQPEIIVVCQRFSPEEVIASCFPVKIIQTDDIPSISVAWNLGIEAASGDYVTNANSDDRLYPGALAQMADVLDTHPEIGVVFGDSDRQEPGKKPEPWKRIKQGTGEYDTKELMAGRSAIGAMPMWRKELGLYDPEIRIAQDFEFFIRLASEGVRFWYIDRALGVYMKRMDGNEWKYKDACIKEHQKIMRKYAHPAN